MGVPGFAKTLFKKYKIVSKYEDRPINELYLDANCLIHPVCFKVFKEYPNLNIADLEHKMINAVIEYIELLIDLVKPTDLIYIAVDGVAPMAKIKHQRLRRFKSIKEFEIKSGIAKKHGKEYPKPWNNSAITPGTIFMGKLTSTIFNHIKSKKDCDKYIFSTYNTPSEGEHKILQYIKTHSSEKSKMIYGLDADLLFLALASNQNNIYLLRESKEINYNLDGFSIVDINCMKSSICSEIDHKIDKEKFIKDYIYLGFLLGNDFVPCLPSINFRFTNDALNGHTILLRVYNKIFENEYLIENDKLNKNMFKKLIDELARIEDAYFQEAALTKHYTHQCESDDPYDQEIHRLDNLLFKINDPIKLGTTGYKERYYKHYNINVKDCIERYFEGLEWTKQYYFDKCPDWLWFYKYDHAPFVSDIKDYLDTTEKLDNYKFINKQVEIKPLQQLLMVLPPKSKFLLPKTWHKFMDSKHYPNNVELDFLMKSKFWQATPMIEIIDPKIIIEQTKDVFLTEYELLRNNQRNDIIFQKKI